MTIFLMVLCALSFVKLNYRALKYVLKPNKLLIVYFMPSKIIHTFVDVSESC